MELRNVIEEAVETALRKYQLSDSVIQTSELHAPAQETAVKKPSRVHKSAPSPLPRQPKPLERPTSKYQPEQNEPAVSGSNMDMLLSMADAFY